jgi:hypothetical protein
MKIKILLYCVIFALAAVFSGCGGNRELKDNAKSFADAMCRNIAVMQKLRAASQDDTLTLQNLQKERQAIDSEMMALSQDFRTKFGEKTKRPEFTKEYRKYLSEYMLDCNCLSKEDRANFEKELK